MIAIAGGAGVTVILRPGWLAVGGLMTAALWWLWVDMEGPTLVMSGSHGLHLADIPVLVAAAAAGVGALRLVLRRRDRG